MRVVIAGAGSVGRSIARELLAHGHEVTLIDRQPSAMRIASVADAEWLLADACEMPTLTEAKVDETLAAKKTVEAKFVKPLPVYIVYFSSAALNDGTIVDYQDVYHRDGKVIAALLNKDGNNADARKADADAAKI